MKNQRSLSAGCPKLTLVGSVVGTLEDAIYGTLAPTSSSMQVKNAYLESQFTDARVLARLRGPSKEDPFRLLALKWHVKAMPGASAVVKAREFYYLESTGIHVSPTSGERIGFHVVHSVDLLAHQMRPVTKDAVRAKVSSCYLLRQMPHDTVDVFARVWFAAGGKVMDSVAIMRACHSLMGMWKWMWCAHNKKLTWHLKTAMTMRARKQVNDGDETSGNAAWLEGKPSCALCVKHASILRSLVACALCERPVCGKCHVVRQLTDVGRSGGIVTLPVRICVSCLTNVAITDATDILLQQYVHIDDREVTSNNPTRVKTSVSPTASKLRARRARTETYPCHQPATDQRDPHEPFLQVAMSLEDLAAIKRTGEALAMSTTSSSGGSSIDSSGPPSSTDSDGSSRSASDGRADESEQTTQARLWLQMMQQLRMDAERTYQQATETTNIYADSSSYGS